MSPGYDRTDILELYRFIDWLIELPEPLEVIFQQELAQYEGEGPMRYVSTIERQGIELGKQELGRSLILRQLTRRIGELPDSTIEHINQLSVQSLEFLGEALLDFEDVGDLHQWLTDDRPEEQT